MVERRVFVALSVPTGPLVEGPIAMDPRPEGLPEDRHDVVTTQSWKGILPADSRQAIRVKRFLMASASALLVVLCLLLFSWLGMMPLDVALSGSAAIFALIAIFYVLFRTGLNLRLADPSLTSEQVGSAIVVLAYVMNAAPQVRHALVILYLMPLMFGVLRLSTARLLVLAMLTFAAHSWIVWLAYRRGHDAGLQTDLIQLAVLALMLPWFAGMGGYTNRLRRRLSDSNRVLAGDVGRIEQLAMHDALTGAFNRRYLDEACERARARAHRLGSPLCVCLFDLDQFKSVNDVYGHPTGDGVLKKFAELAASGLRSSDTLGRYGGEEFLLVLPDTTTREATVAAERIRAVLEGASFSGLPEDRRVTVTAGIALLRADESVASWIARADAALYEGKGAGRNRIVAAN